MSPEAVGSDDGSKVVVAHGTRCFIFLESQRTSIRTPQKPLTFYSHHGNAHQLSWMPLTENYAPVAKFEPPFLVFWDSSDISRILASY